MKVETKSKIGSIQLPLKENEFFDLLQVERVLSDNNIKTNSSRQDALMPFSHISFWLPSASKKVCFNLTSSGKITILGNWSVVEVNVFIESIFFNLLKPCIKRKVA